MEEAGEDVEDEDEVDDSISNPTPAMKELMKKRKSLGKQVCVDNIKNYLLFLGIQVSKEIMLFF